MADSGAKNDRQKQTPKVDLLMKRLLLGCALAALLTAPAVSLAAERAPAHARPAMQAKYTNPLLAPWSGPHGGYPRFDHVRVADFAPAIDEAIALNRLEIARIANNPAKPTFENTIVALERSGQPLARVQAIYGIWTANLSTPEVQKLQAQLDPKLAAFGDEITQNPKLFARIEAVYNSPQKAKLRPDQQRLSWLYWNNFVLAGARLSPPAKARVAEINQRLAVLSAQFQQHLLADESSYITYLKPGDLAGLPDSFKAAAAAAAEAHGRKG